MSLPLSNADGTHTCHSGTTSQASPHQRPTMICGFTLTELAHVALQVIGVIIAGVFGAWAIRSYDSANVANRLSENSLSQSDDANRLAQAALQQSEIANVLAIINLCLYEQLRNSTTDCSAVLQAPLLASIIQRVLPTSKMSSSTPTLPSPTTPRVETTTPRLDTTTTPRLATPTIPLPPSPSSRTPPVQSSQTTRATEIPTIIYRPDTTSVSSSLNSDQPSPSPSTSYDRSQPGIIGFGTIVGVIIAVVVTLAFICLVLIRYRRSKRSRFGAP